MFSTSMKSFLMNFGTSTKSIILQEENIKKKMGNKEHDELLKQNKIRIEVKLDRDYNSRKKWNEDKWLVRQMTIETSIQKRYDFK